MEILLTKEDAIAFLSKVIVKDIRHQYYERVTDKAEIWRALVSGEGLDGYLHQFKVREADDLFEQRKRITKHIVHSVCKNVRDVEYKIPRSNSIKRVMAFVDGKEEDMKKWDDIMEGFWGDSSFTDYFDTRWIELNDSDPNSFVVLEWGEFKTDEGDIQPYPFEVKSEEAIYYEYQNRILQFLIVKLIEDNELPSFTFYGKDFSLKFFELSKEDADKLDIQSKNSLIERDGKNYIRLDDDKTYMILIPDPHNLGEVPAFRVGYVRDQYTDGKTYLPPWWPAEPVLMNMLQAKSELDLTIALHVFPQKLQYTSPCRAQGCRDGFLASGDRCTTCKGSGIQIVTSAQESIILPIPKDKEDMIDLENLVKYLYPPIDLVKFQDEYIKNLSARCLQFVYNSEIYSRKEVAETATGKNIDLQAIYDTLYPMVVAMSNHWEWSAKVISRITGYEKGFICSFTFGKDFKLKSLEDYLFDLKIIKESGGSSFIKASIEDDIARLIYSDNQQALSRYLTERRFFPFTGDPPEAIAMKMTQNFIPKFYKTLYSVYGFIFDELVMDESSFFDLNPEKQWEMIEIKVGEYMATNESEIPPPPTFPPIQEGDGEGEEEGIGNTGNEGDEPEGNED